MDACDEELKEKINKENLKISLKAKIASVANPDYNYVRVLNYIKIIGKEHVAFIL